MGQHLTLSSLGSAGWLPVLSPGSLASRSGGLWRRKVLTSHRARGVEGQRALFLWVQFLVLPLIGCVTLSHLTALNPSFIVCRIAE